MATAVTTGAAGLLLQNRPKLTPAGVKSVLTNTTQRYGWAAVGGPRPDPAAAGRRLVALPDPVRVGADVEEPALSGNRLDSADLGKPGVGQPGLGQPGVGQPG